ncbi:unnamed protein product [Mycena citricolor]|uniref:Tr-type G domain-containing protein n=1 Tax=Mycena citricolor TaxID=2018698 RepID=A0AAD2JWI3_9AGAR|nr:unnamed protein product [Mycena citricolor]
MFGPIIATAANQLFVTLTLELHYKALPEFPDLIRRQSEIDEQSREAIKQHRAANQGLTLDKENHKPALMKGKGKDDEVEAAIPDVEVNATDLAEMEEKFISLLISDALADRERARDLVASLITSRSGEYVLRIGLHPPRSQLLSDELDDNHNEWTGISRTEEELKNIKSKLKGVVEEIGGKTCVLYELKGRACLLLRLPPPNVTLTPEVRCAVVGNVDSGKSTTLGVLTRGALDDGRGSARVGLFRHKHEITTGRTSSVGFEILGFNPAGEAILPKTAGSNDPDVIRREKLGWEEISVQAAKIVSFIDLAGHERYLKTTLYGLTSGAPSCVILMVGANAGLIGMSKEHLAIALALSVPIVVCITKIDMTPPNVLAETVKQVVKILKSPGCRKTPVFVKTAEVAVEVSTGFGKDRVCPIFMVSNVTGEGLENACGTFHQGSGLMYPVRSECSSIYYLPARPIAISLLRISPWSSRLQRSGLSHTLGRLSTVGIVNSGSVRAGDAIVFGPDSNGNFQNSIVRSIQRKRANVPSGEAGQCVSLALKRVKRSDVRKGMVIVHKTDVPPRAVRQFEGQVLILYHNTTLQKNYQAMLHCEAVRQTVRIISMGDAQCLRTGDRATVQFEFISHPEYIKEGMKLLFREGKTKGLGVITRLL